MIDYDDMNEVLGKEEKELAEEEARRQQKIADALSRDRPTDSGRPGVYSPVFGDTSEKPAENSDSTEDETWDESKYDIYMTIYESAKNKLDLKLESARKDYDGVDRRKQNEWTDLLGVIIGFLIHTGGYPVVYTLFVLKNVTNAITLVSFTFLGLFWPSNAQSLKTTNGISPGTTKTTSCTWMKCSISSHPLQRQTLLPGDRGE